MNSAYLTSIGSILCVVQESASDWFMLTYIKDCTIQCEYSPPSRRNICITAIPTTSDDLLQFIGRPRVRRQANPYALHPLVRRNQLWSVDEKPFPIGSLWLLCGL